MVDHKALILFEERDVWKEFKKNPTKGAISIELVVSFESSLLSQHQTNFFWLHIMGDWNECKTYSTLIQKRT